MIKFKGSKLLESDKRYITDRVIVGIDNDTYWTFFKGSGTHFFASLLQVEEVVFDTLIIGFKNESLETLVNAVVLYIECVAK